MSTTIEFNGTREDLRRLLTEFVHALSGDPGPFAPYVHGIKLRAGMVALACVQEAFLVKSAGGTGDDGIQWKPLSPRTIASRPLGPADRALMRGYGDHNGRDSLGRIKRGFLTPVEDKRWRMLYCTRKAWLMNSHGLDEGAASAQAAQIAWSTLKSEGAKTKLAVLGGRQVMIGRSSGRLFASLSCGTATPETHPLLQSAPDAPDPADRILREETGAVVVGSNVEYAQRFHSQRPLWPTGDLPPVWQERINEAVQSGIEEAINMIMGSFGGQRAA